MRYGNTCRLGTLWAFEYYNFIFIRNQKTLRKLNWLVHSFYAINNCLGIKIHFYFSTKIPAKRNIMLKRLCGTNGRELYRHLV